MQSSMLLTRQCPRVKTVEQALLRGCSNFLIICRSAYLSNQGKEDLRGVCERENGKPIPMRRQIDQNSSTSFLENRGRRHCEEEMRVRLVKIDMHVCLTNSMNSIGFKYKKKDHNCNPNYFEFYDGLILTFFMHILAARFIYGSGLFSRKGVEGKKTCLRIFSTRLIQLRIDNRREARSRQASCRLGKVSAGQPASSRSPSNKLLINFRCLAAFVSDVSLGKNVCVIFNINKSRFCGPEYCREKNKCASRMNESRRKSESSADSIPGQDDSPDLDWDNFFPYVEFCDSGSSEEESNNINGEATETTSPNKLGWISSGSLTTTSTSTIQSDHTPGKKGGVSPMTKEALCVPSLLSPPPGIPSEDPNPTFKKPVGKAKIAKRLANTFKKMAETKLPANTDGISGLAETRESEGRGEISPSSAPNDKDTKSGAEIRKRSRRSCSLDRGLERKVITQEFSITDMVAEADERDFRHRAASNSERRGPLLSSTINDSEEESEEEVLDLTKPILRGGNNKNKSESLKESFRKRTPITPDESRERTANGRRLRRNDKFNEGRDLGTDGEFSPKSSTEEMERSREISPIISTGRRGMTTTNWADVTIGSEYSVRSDGNATFSGPKRKTRRGKKKKRNLSVSNTNVAISESFRASLEGNGIGSGLGSPNSNMSRDASNNSGKRMETNNDSRLTKNDGAAMTAAGAGRSNPLRRTECPMIQKISERFRAGNPYEGGREGILSLNDSRVITYDNEYATQRYREDHPPTMDSTQEIDLNMLLPAGCRVPAGRKIRTKSVIQFVIMRREESSNSEWEFFPKKAMENLINNVEGRNASTGNGLSTAFKFANLWGEVPLLGLYATDISIMNGYRFQIELYSDGFEYQTFPREALDKRLALTIMMWQNLEGIRDEAIAQNLLDRNRELAGGIKVARVRLFRKDDLDSRGNSMLGARLVQLDGNETFLRSLERFPQSHRFGLGVGTVIIRGGDRAPEPPGSTWGQGRANKPQTYSQAVAANLPATVDLNISAASLHSYTRKASKVLDDAEKSIRGRKMFNSSKNDNRTKV